MGQICRLCLKVIIPKNNEYVSVHQTDNNGVAIATLVKALVPELYLGLSVNPVICPPCYDALRDAYSFRLQCLRSENLIGIFMRETHCSSVTIVLQDVVNYWMNVYKTKPCQSEVARANLAEWFGVEQSEETMQSKWAIKRRRKRVEFNKAALEELVRDDTTKNDISEAKADVPETENPKSPAESDEEVSRLDSQEVEKSVEGKECSVDGSEPQMHEPSSLDKENDSNKVTETTKNPPKDICDCPPVDVCPTSELFKQKVHCKFQKMKEKQHAGCVDACEYRHKHPCKYYKPYSAIFSAQANDKLAADAVSKNVLDSPTVIPPVKTYTKKQSAKSTEEIPKNTEDARELALPVQEASHEEQTRLSLHEENNIENILKQLQNNENLENFNFINDELDIGQTHVIKRFPSKTNKCFSYALLPKSICDNAFDIVKKEKDDHRENIRGDSPTRQVSDASSISILKSKAQRMSENKMGNESIQTTEKDTAVVPEACTSRKSSDKEAEERNDVDDKSVDSENEQTSKPDSSVAKPKLPEEKDEESLGIITFNSELSFPEQLGDKPMPMIRVRPVSSLQKIRTLNHELFPTPPETSKIQDVPPLIITQPLKVAKLPVGPPVVLNSKLLPGMNPTLLGSIVLPEPANQSLKVVTKTYTKSLGVPTRLMQVTLDHVKKMGINPLKLKKLKAVKPLKKLLPVESGSQNEETISAAPLNISDPIAGGSRGISALRDEEAIDIKEEPLDFGENDPLCEMDPFEGIPNGLDSWDGESTKDADETLFMDEMVTDNLTQLIENIPAVVEEEFDEPEYVHINKVSFDDLTKLMKESKQYKKDFNQEKESFNSKTDASRTSLLLAINEPEKLTRQDMSDPLHIPQRKARPRKKVGKRLRLVPVEVEESQVPKKKRRRSSVAIEKHFSNDQQNVCVLFTNFTSDGDYINDHDYLVNPYTRNNMSIFKRKVDSCLCLLCDLVHPARSHIEHMRCHTTRCFICRIDFHNVFILNLHVRCHTSHCEECGVNVTYARYRHHAETHNNSPMLSNIYLPREDPPPKRRRTRAASSRSSDTSSTTKKSRRRMTRNSRSKNYENVELEDEEACIYDKATKSFVTPTLDKRQKQSARTSKKKEVENKADISSTSPSTPQSQIITLTSLLSDSNPADLNSNNSFIPNNSTTNSEKATQQKAATAKTNKRRRKLYSERSRKKVAKSGKVERNNKAENSSQATENAANEPEKKATKTHKLVCDFGALRLSEDNPDDVNVASIGNPEAVPIKKSPAKKAFPKSVPESSSNASEVLTNKTRIMKNDNTNVLEPAIKADIEPNAVIKTKILIRKGHSIKSATLRRVTETNAAQARKSLLARPRKDSLLKVKESPSVLSPKGVKSPLQDDVQVKIRCIKLHPLDIQEANKIESVLKSRFLEKKRKKEQDSVAEAVSKEITDKVEAHDNVSMQEFAERVQPSRSASKRSSRSRGSLNLVEGLKVDGPARSKKPRKSISSSLPPPEKRDAKRQTVDPLSQPLEVKSQESSHIANVKASERKKEDPQS